MSDSGHKLSNGESKPSQASASLCVIAQSAIKYLWRRGLGRERCETDPQGTFLINKKTKLRGKWIYVELLPGTAVETVAFMVGRAPHARSPPPPSHPQGHRVHTLFNPGTEGRGFPSPCTLSAAGGTAGQGQRRWRKTQSLHALCVQEPGLATLRRSASLSHPPAPGSQALVTQTLPWGVTPSKPVTLKNAITSPSRVRGGKVWKGHHFFTSPSFSAR